MRQRGLLLAVASIATLAVGNGIARGTTLQEIAPAGTYTNPLFITSEPTDPPNPDRLLIVEQAGVIKLTEGATTSTFLDVSSLVESGGEEGLLSMAPAPDYTTSKHFYVFYVSSGGNNLQIDEYTANTIPVDIATRRPVLSVPHTTAANHNAGQLQFGPDGYLYISTGDGGNTPTLAQDTNSLLGKILRIDPDQDGANPYSVPADNPFVGVAGADEIWSYGLRNPFRFSFDRATGALLIGDVGQNMWEEVNYEPGPNAGRGDNYGWACREGMHTISTSGACAGLTGYTDPIHEYSHADGSCSITGGYVVRDPGLGALVGRYLYADFCAGQIRSLVPGLPQASCDRAEGLFVQNPSSFGEDSSGRIYVASLTGGTVWRLVGDSTASCPPDPPPPDPPPPDPPPPDPPPPDPPPPPPPTVEPDPTADAPGQMLDQPPASASPAMRLAARDEQRLGGDRRLVCNLSADQSTDAIARLALIAGDDVLLRRGKKRLELAPGATERISWRLSRGEARSLRRPLRAGELEARFRARAVDPAGNEGPRVEAVSALRD